MSAFRALDGRPSLVVLGSTVNYRQYNYPITVNMKEAEKPDPRTLEELREELGKAVCDALFVRGNGLYDGGDIKAIQYPFSELKENGSIGYIEEGQYKIEKPEPFNMEQESLSLTGKHNIYNSLAAGIASDVAGIKKEDIRKSLSDFPGVEHRLEKVCTVRGVQYINDSKATNVDACWYALESMKTKTILIIGGKDKGNDYEPIKPLVKEKCAGLVYLGADNQKLHDNFDSLGIPVRDTHSMKDCVAACYEMAEPGMTVLLSPCCASFDLFKNMEDRGEQFKELARNL
jgi:UDP-N-acetylmuramoylalanine--D-glutamate ligase